MHCFIHLNYNPKWDPNKHPKSRNTVCVESMLFEHWQVLRVYWIERNRCKMVNKERRCHLELGADLFFLMHACNIRHKELFSINHFYSPKYNPSFDFLQRKGKQQQQLKTNCQCDLTCCKQLKLFVNIRIFSCKV